MEHDGIRERNLTRALRRCLGCGKMFDSAGPGRRFCPRCRKHRGDPEQRQGEPRRGLIVW